MNDIEILEELRHELGLYANGEKVRQGQAIENLIQRNKDLEQIEKEHKEENGRLREEVKKLKKIDLSNSKIIANMSERHFQDREKIRKFEKTILLESKPTILGMIPISKLKEKIEELNKEEKKTLKGTKGQDRYSIKLEYMHKRNALQELLEESDK